MHFKFCDLIEKDQFFGSALRQGKFAKPCPYGPVILQGPTLSRVAAAFGHDRVNATSHWYISCNRMFFDVPQHVWKIRTLSLWYLSVRQPVTNSQSQAVKDHLFMTQRESFDLNKLLGTIFRDKLYTILVVLIKLRVVTKICKNVYNYRDNCLHRWISSKTS